MPIRLSQLIHALGFLSGVLSASFLGVSYAKAQDVLPPPRLLVQGDVVDDLQLSHAFSIRLRPDYCFHSFVMAYGNADPLTDIHLTLQFGSGGSRVAEANLRFPASAAPLLMIVILVLVTTPVAVLMRYG